ncbi:C6 finger domain protein [Penicillium cataractarum]|uniref:C6 finger domain protein n=1 Tax=Penicillium cataractarum TaxID=2100454 RepID=A0A9W9V630_9EURO|nr:C6 finger domain protein [Penicillium cataractarum]KAJ5370268.1 C6 finger domain protein [Penicillium cataractarum]
MPPHPMEVEDMPRSAPKSRFRPKQRISHTKSRNGCYTCKQRRVKCDEERPTCGACFVRGEDCVFPNPGGTRDLRRRQPPLPRERPSSENVHVQTRENIREIPFHPLSFNVAPSEEPQYVGDQPRSSLNMSDLNLLQHYILHTSKKMTLHKIKSVVWERVIPEMASVNEFLMHLVLALAGLDILTSGDARTANVQGSPSSSMFASVPHLRSIMEHHQQGLAGLQEALCATSDPDAETLLAGSMLVVGFAFASFGIKDLDPSTPTLQDNLNLGHASPPPLPDASTLHIQWLHLVRGVTSILRQFWPTLRKCRLRALLTHNQANDDWKLCEEQVRSTICPSSNIRSKRLRKFANGANRAVSDLRGLHTTLRQSSNSEEVADGSPFATPQSDQVGNSGQPLLDAYEQAIGVVDDIYMRILYVMQMKPLDSQSSSDLELQTDLEDAAVSSWPHLLPEEFISSLDWQGNIDMLHGLSLLILAHLYLTIAILDELWYCGKRCDVEIYKINTLIVALGDEKLVSLMDWPIDVIR